MYLEKIKKVNDVKKYNDQEKRILANEIRDYLIRVVAKNGGHLASNLGVVELTIALESVFDVNHDKIIWDVGHQSYVHKILTGRREELQNLRQMNGISGFPKTSESPTDCFNTGHSSTSISAAMGMAKARDIQGKKYHVVSVIGDGALTGGMALEALNHVGSDQTKMIIVLNDNEMSISRNISGMNKLLTKLRSRKNYRKSNRKWREFISKVPVIGKGLTKMIRKGKTVVKQVFVPGMYFEEIGIKYLGPVNGHNIEDLENLFEKAKNFDEPVVIHVLTKKGKGYSYAEEDPAKFHGISPFDIKTGDVLKKSKSYSKVFGDTLIELAKDNKKIVAITAAMKDGVGLAEFAEKYPKRFFDVGIAEEHALTFAAGLAKEGMIPVVSIYSSFYQRAYDQVIHDICMQSLPVVMCVDRAGIVGNDGETHQGLYDMAFFRVVPNLTILSPKDFLEFEKMLEFAVKLGKPVVIRYPRGGEEKNDWDCPSIKMGHGEIIQTGKNLTIVGFGKTVKRAFDVAELLKEEKVSCEVINLRFLKPFDKELLIKSISKTKRVMVIEDGTRIGGVSTAIEELLVEENLKAEAFFYTYPDQYIKHGSVSQLEKKYGLDAKSIAKDFLEKRKSH